MNKHLTKPRIKATVGMLLSIPTAYFILINVLNEFGWNGLYDAAQPMLQNLGIRQFGWNINLLILFGPVLALLLNGLSVLKIRIQFTKESFDCHLSIAKSWWNLAVVFLSGGCLLFLFAYLLGENCR